VAEQAGLGFGGLLRQLRDEAGLTQEELAEAAQVSQRAVSDLERGINATARKDTTVLLAGALGLHVHIPCLPNGGQRGSGIAARIPPASRIDPHSILAEGISPSNGMHASHSWQHLVLDGADMERLRPITCTARYCCDQPYRGIRLTAMDVAALVVSIVSVLIAAGSLRYAHDLGQSAEKAADAAVTAALATVKTADATEKSAATAQDSLALQVLRRQDALTPRFRATLEKRGPEVGKLRLRLTFIGPPAIGGLDVLTVTILDDRAWRALGRTLSAKRPEWADTQIWAPYRFETHAPPRPGSADVGMPSVDETGRTMRAHEITLAEELTLPLEATVPPQVSPSLEKWVPWLGKYWMRDTTGIQLQLECSRQGWDPWTLPCDVDAARLGEPVEVP
jgi:transcriptional regulator with XRE-family HTH domain